MAEFDLYCNYDCIGEYDNFDEAKKNFLKEVEDNPTAEIDVISSDGETTYLSYDPTTKVTYNKEHLLCYK